MKLQNELRNDLRRGSIDGVDSNGPRDGQKPPKPGPLLLAVPTSSDLDPLHSLLEPESPPQVLTKFSIPDRFDRLRTKPTGVIETSNLVEKACLHHGPNSGVDSTIEQIRRPVQHHDPDRRTATDRFSPFGLMLGEWASGDGMHFQSPDHPPSVVGMNPLGRRGVDLGQTLMQRCLIDLLEFRPDGIVPSRALEDTFKEGAGVEIGASHENRNPTAGVDVADLCFRPIKPVAKREGFTRGIDHPAEMMGNAVLLLRSRLRGPDHQIGVDLHRIGDHALPAAGNRLREGNRDVGLPPSGRAEKKNDRGFRIVRGSNGHIATVAEHGPAIIRTPEIRTQNPNRNFAVSKPANHARRTIDDIDVADLTVLVRVDFNVPLQDGRITDDTRIRAALPTIRSVTERGGSVVLMSHLGRPGGTGPEPPHSLAPVAARLGEHLECEVGFPSDDCTDARSREAIAALEPGGVLLLENLRFHPGEKKGDETFARTLATGVDGYCNDAFGTAHRADASMVAVAQAMGDRPRVAGRLLEKELQYLGQAIEAAERPFVAILGGAKISDKLKTIRRLAGTVDTLIVGGAMAFTLLKARGHTVGRSLVEESMVEEAGRMIEELASSSTTLLLPSDFTCGSAPEKGNPTSVHGTEIPADLMGLDIGPESARIFAETVRTARTVVWNGPMGLFEIKPFDVGTRIVAEALVEATNAGAVTIVGGGDTAAAVQGLGLGSAVSHVSTGGGASLTMLEGGPMPALEVLDPA